MVRVASSLFLLYYRNETKLYTSRSNDEGHIREYLLYEEYRGLEPKRERKRSRLREEKPTQEAKYEKLR